MSDNLDMPVLLSLKISSDGFLILFSPHIFALPLALFVQSNSAHSLFLPQNRPRSSLLTYEGGQGQGYHRPCFILRMAFLQA